MTKMLNFAELDPGQVTAFFAGLTAPGVPADPGDGDDADDGDGDQTEACEVVLL